MTLKAAIFATLAYHDIFDYPLTETETYSYLIVKSTTSLLKENLQLLIKEKKLGQKNSLLFLRGRGQAVKIRQARKRASIKKLKKTLFYAKIIRTIPTVRLVAVSGALSMENADTNDDIDLLIVTSAHSLWTTRLLANLLLQPYRRKAGEAHTKDKACLNMFLEESSLKIRTKNLYIAHELAQVKPIWQRGGTYQNLVKANSWVKNYLPNWQPHPIKSFTTYDQSNSHSLASSALSLIEPLAKAFQLRYMKKRITTEEIGDTQLFFHPGNTQQYILGKYEAKLRTLR